jgi:hypothetical protein
MHPLVPWLFRQDQRSSVFIRGCFAQWQLYDCTAADGPRKTLWIGIIESRTCTQFMGGPVVDCPP